MSKVYRALDRQTDQTVCLKIQIRDKCEAAASRCSDEKPCEGEIGMRIVHPHVARTLDWGRTRSRASEFIVMEYVDGVSLEYVREAIKLGLRGKMKLLVQAAEGFAGIHAAGFIHHDINPRNILINKKNQIKIIDFGLAVPNTPAFHKPGNRTGALPYMAPELIRREPTDERLDVFAFARRRLRVPHEPAPLRRQRRLDGDDAPADQQGPARPGPGQPQALRRAVRPPPPRPGPPQGRPALDGDDRPAAGRCPAEAGGRVLIGAGHCPPSSGCYSLRGMMCRGAIRIQLFRATKVGGRGDAEACPGGGDASASGACFASPRPPIEM